MVKALKSLRLFLFLALAMGLFSSCATLVEEEFVPKSVNSDLVPNQMSRSQYYQDMAKSFMTHERFEEATEHLRLALLHDPNNHSARFDLARVYHLTGQSHLALVELEKYLRFEKIKDDQIQMISDIYEKSGSFTKVRDLNDDYFKTSGSVASLWKVYEMNLALGNFSDAENTVIRLQKTQEDKFRLHMAFVAIFSQQKKYSEALKHLAWAEKEKPLNELVMRKQVEYAYALQDWATVHAVAAKYAHYHPYDIEVSERWSNAAIFLGEYEVALYELKKQKDMVPDSIGLEYKMAYVFFMMKDYANARQAYDDLFKLTGSDQSVFYLSQIHLIDNKYDEAKALMEDLASWSEYYPISQVQLARLEWKNGERNLALNRLRRAHLARTDSLEIYHEYAQFLIWSGNFIEAVALIEKAQIYYTDDDQLRILSAYAHFKLGNERKFRTDMRIAVKKNPKNAEIYAVMSELWYEKGRSVTELEYFARKALEMKSENKNLKPLLAWALLQQNKLTESVKIFEEYYDQNPKELFFAESLAEIYNRNSLPDKTSEYEQRVVELKLDQRIKTDLNYFRNQNQIDKTDTTKIRTRLPASLENP